MITNKDISIDKHGSIILNGDKYPLASQAEIDAVKDDIDDLGDTIGDITQTGVTGADVASQIGALNTGLSNLIKTQYVDTVVASIASNSGTAIAMNLTIPTGYSCIGVLQSLTSASAVSVTGAFIDTANSSVKINVYNNSTAASNVTVAATVLYVKS